MGITDVIRAAEQSDQAFSSTLRRELEEKRLTVRDFSSLSGVPANTLYKILSGARQDIRLSTLRAILRALRQAEAGPTGDFIAVLASRPVLDVLGNRSFEVGDREFSIKEYAVSTLEDTMVAAVRAEREGARAIVCAPIASTTIEKLVTLPVTTMMPGEGPIIQAIERALAKVG